MRRPHISLAVAGAVTPLAQKKKSLNPKMSPVEHISLLLPRGILTAMFNGLVSSAMDHLVPRRNSKASLSHLQPQSEDSPPRKPLTLLDTNCRSLSLRSTHNTSSSGNSFPPSHLDTPGLPTFTHYSSEYDNGDSDSDDPATPRISIISPITPSYASPFNSPADPLQLHQVQNPVSSDTDDSVLTPPTSPSPSLPPSPRKFHEPSVSPVGRLKFMHSLCSGSYGAAYAARDLATTQVICAKVFKKDVLSMRRDRYFGSLIELGAYQQISKADENSRKWLMELHGAVQDEGHVMFVMDLMDCDLFTMLREPVSKSTVRLWIAQIALGIDALHKMGIIHRDIKPENVFVTPGTYNVRIGDFTNAWVAPLEDGSESCVEGHLESGAPLDWWKVYSRQLIGTREYLAPEMKGREWYGVMVDWWALGCVAYDLLVGDAIFPDDDKMNLYLKYDRLGLNPHDYFHFRSHHITYLIDDERSLLAGLLSISPLKRFRLEYLEEHPFFVDHGRNVFHVLRGTSFAASRRASFVTKCNIEVSSTSRTDTLCSDFPELSYSSSTKDEDMFGNFNWIGPRGIWATC